MYNKMQKKYMRLCKFEQVSGDRKDGADNDPLLRGEKCDEKCVAHCLEWLKQPAEGE